MGASKDDRFVIYQARWMDTLAQGYQSSTLHGYACACFATLALRITAVIAERYCSTVSSKFRHPIAHGAHKPTGRIDGRHRGLAILREHSHARNARVRPWHLATEERKNLKRMTIDSDRFEFILSRTVVHKLSKKICVFFRGRFS